MSIKFYRLADNFGFCSNFAHTRIYIYGHWWATVEHAYQAQKTLNVEEQNQIRFSKTPRNAREIGQTVTMRPDWDNIKYKIMKECVLAKFVQHHDLREKLLVSGNEELIENSKIDAYWGIGANGDGQNKLGIILMEIRDELKR